MATFAPRLASQQVDRVARLQTMMDMPFTLTRNLGEQAQQGVLDSFGLGTVVRDIAIPAGNTAPRVNPAAAIPGPVGAIAQGYEAGRNLINGMRPDQPSLSEAEYKASPYFRTDIPFEQGMTEDRAAAMAMFYDTKKVREYFGEKRPFSTFIGQFAGQALDPINYVPVFGQAAEAAAVARIGTIAGRAVLGSADAAINTAAFGLMTAGLRDQFGDDTSWQAMTSEIAMSALIGGAFGGVSGVVSNAITTARGRVDRKLEAAVADALTDLRGVKESRAVLNEAIGDMAAGRDVNLSPNGAAAVERIQTAAMNRAATARALDEQTASIPDGAKVAITPAGSRVEIRPEVVELDSLVNASGALQVRNRSSQASAAQVEQIATTLDPARLMTSVDADSGAPIVGGDNVVDSGNGRVMAIRRAYEAYPERAGSYRKALETAGYDLTGIRNPVLISRRVTALSDDARATFNAEANAPRAAQMSAVELASMDRNALDGTLDVLDPSPVTSAANRAFVQRFLGNLVPSARGALVDPSGAINADGVRRIENALVAQAYGDVDVGVLRRFAEATDDNTRSIVGAMSDVAGKWAAMRQSIKRGDISPEFDMTRELTDALRMIGQWREQAAREGRPVSQVIREGMAQLDLLSGEISPETQALVSAFYQTNSFARAAGRDTIAQLLGRIVDAAEELGRPQLFGEIDVTRLEVIRNAASNEQGNLFTPIGADDGIEADGGFNRGTPAAADRQSDRPGTGQGAVADRMTERFVAAGRPEPEARATAEIVDAFYAQQASRLGLTMDEMVEQFGLPEVRRSGDVPDEAAMAQAPDNPAFREWFGDSKVVDANGEPLVVYHGSNASFDEFSLSGHPDRLDPANGFFFTADPQYSFVRAKGFEGENRQVYPVYLRIENPLFIDRSEKMEGLNAWTDARDYVADLKRQGYDGIIWGDPDDLRKSPRGAWGDDRSQIFVFEPTQIKSVNNRGTFDPNDPRILNQPAYHGTPHLFDKFSTEKIGTGEGNQAFGWGLYFASSKEVSQWYRSTLVQNREKFKILSEAEHRALDARDISRFRDTGDYGDVMLDDAIARDKAALESDIEDLPSRSNPAFFERRIEYLRQRIAAMEKLRASGDRSMDTPTGRLFEVDVPGDDELMDWDAPLRDQPESVRVAAAKVLGSEIVGDMTGRGVHDTLRARAQSRGEANPARAASESLAAAGIPGHRYIGNESQSKNYVIYDDSRVTVSRFEQGGENPRGAIVLGDTDVITLFETADASTALHETGHLFLSMLKGMGGKADAPEAIKADWESVQGWWRENAEAVAVDANASGRAQGVTAQNVIDALDIGTTGDAAKDRAIDVGMQEQWARGFEAYVREGNAPTAGLARAFEQFKQWLQSIYRRAADLNVNLSPDIRRVFDNLLAEPTSRAEVKIDGMPVRVRDAANDDAPAVAEPVTAQKSLMLNEPDNAAARVGKDESLRDIALSHGVDPATGGFVEQGDIAQMREEGRLTADDEAVLADADQMFADAEAYGRALDAAVACIV